MAALPIWSPFVLLVSVLLFVAVSIDHPFSGDVAVRPTSLERVLADFGRRVPRRHPDGWTL